MSISLAPPVRATAASGTAFTILFAISASHLMNDLLQSLLPAIYPLLRQNYALSFTQIGLLTLTLQITASLLQPLVGFYTDKRPLPYSLAAGMGSTFLGLLLMSQAHGFAWLVGAAALVGLGSSVFHPESSRVARMASGGRHGLAQSVFQVGGNAGQALGPVMAALVIMPHGQGSLGWFSLVAVAGMVLLTQVGRWYGRNTRAKGGRAAVVRPTGLSRRRTGFAVAILLVLIFSKYFYTASLNTYYTFYLIERFHLPVRDAQLYLALFLAAFAAGTLLGGPIGDRVGRRAIIWTSILGVLPFTLALPYANLFWTVALTVPIGLILASAFSAILVYAQELLPGNIGTVSGLFFGFAFGMGALGAAVLGQLADRFGLPAVYQACAFLPAIGLLTALLPKLEPPRHAA